MASNFDDSIPVTFRLPDGDEAKLITWSYVLKELNTQLSPVINTLSNINTDLERINARADYWLEQQEEEGN